MSVKLGDCQLSLLGYFTNNLHQHFWNIAKWVIHHCNLLTALESVVLILVSMYIISDFNDLWLILPSPVLDKLLCFREKLLKKHYLLQFNQKLSKLNQVGMNLALISVQTQQISTLKIHYSDTRCHSPSTMSRMAFVLCFHNPSYCLVLYWTEVTFWLFRQQLALSHSP